MKVERWMKGEWKVNDDESMDDDEYGACRGESRFTNLIDKM